ncbi:glutamyl-tRNA amidotransferase [Taibaiella sp. KBW10]|uniref:GatB/YqeY domain-containing protein n=1 Tax=Taibaiella sp. KBW10 TaxID=2153357 RepID=UPI000F5930AE|nr:GatB/YqeY domain-containing protein [Taibaiella sp. KBW10]RQO30106.1 glutamyl-tRNA amidotransferase [Taibaiella sp. KBW10]
MSLEAKVMDELKMAMRAKDDVALRTLRAIKAAILVEQTATGAKAALDEADELKLLTKMAKQRKDSLEIFTQQGRADLARKEEEEIVIINKFLPAQLSAEELEAAIKDIIAQVGASSAADLGKVMGVASKQFAGKADGKAVSETVKRLLN